MMTLLNDALPALAACAVLLLAALLTAATTTTGRKRLTPLALVRPENPELQEAVADLEAPPHPEPAPQAFTFDGDGRIWATPTTQPPAKKIPPPLLANQPHLPHSRQQPRLAG